MNFIKPFWPYLKNYKARIAWGVLMVALAQVASSAIPYMLKLAVDAIEVGLESESKDAVLSTVAFYALIIVALALVQMAFGMGMRWQIQATSRYVENDIREQYFRHLLTMSMKYYSQMPTGDLMSRATHDVNSIRMFLSFGIRMLFDAAIALTLGLTVMCFIDWQLALYALIPMPFLTLAMNRVAGRINTGFREVQELFADISSRVQENLSGIRVVKAYVQREGEIETFEKLNRQYLNKNKRLIGIESIIRPLAFLLSGTSLIIVLWLGGERVLSGQISLGDFVAFNGYLTKLIFPIILVGWMIDRYQRAIAAMRRINAILEEKTDIEDADDVITPEEIRGDVELRNLTFGYDKKTVILDNLNLKIPAGSSVAIVGRVGSGKTTLGRLIPRLIQAGAGQLLIDGIPVEKLPLQVLRENIGFVPQDSFLFSDSLRENIALGVVDPTEEDITWAMETSQLLNDLGDFPQGLDTMVGERGVTFSGGQKQRTALARAVIRRPKILILDDAMASVDTHTEEEILRRLKVMMAGRTTIIIAHRISTVMGADQIVVLDGGKVVELGTHDALLANNGTYAEMYQRQQLNQELSEI
ncbi:MAG: ATP-binding cassette subfamily B multidrug efflux pump [Candidatus Latescibacterota bacterium]|jgi:ATP-binding cassette subfamily B multidrug efflux pump